MFHYFSVLSRLKAAAILTIALASFFVAGFFIAQYMYQHQIKDDETVVCTARTTYLFENMKANILLEFMADPTRQAGVVSVSGKFYKDNKITGTLRRKIPYTWVGSFDYVQLHSAEIRKSSIDDTVEDALLEKVLPDFYVFSNKSIDYTVSKEGTDGWLFIIGRSPKFLCEETPNT